MLQTKMLNDSKSSQTVVLTVTAKCQTLLRMDAGVFDHLALMELAVDDHLDIQVANRARNGVIQATADEQLHAVLEQTAKKEKETCYLLGLVCTIPFKLV